jgi:single stranded DNA-binding protein
MSTTAATITIRGRLGNSPQLRTTQTGEPVANFNLAIDQGYGERKTTVWVRVTTWGKLAQAVADNLDTGDLVTAYAESFRVSAWNDKNGSPQGQLEITARRVDFIITKHEQAADTGDEEMPF